jgi:hypothetical protein
MPMNQFPRWQPITNPVWCLFGVYSYRTQERIRYRAETRATPSNPLKIGLSNHIRCPLNNLRKILD